MDEIFVLKIGLGNNAMQSGQDVAEALRATADRLEKITGKLASCENGYVKDAIGNTVGEWEVQ